MFYKIINAISENEDAWDLGKVLNYNEFEIKKMNTPMWQNIIQNPIEIKIDEEFGEEELDYNLSSTGIQIVSEKFKNLLTNDEADFYPVLFSNFKSRENYYALRINSFYDCVNEKISEFEYWSIAEIQSVPIRRDTYKSLNRFNIDESKIGRSRIFRLMKYFPSIIIYESLKNIFEKTNITGLKYESIG
jgi:hypothetical protein